MYISAHILNAQVLHNEKQTIMKELYIKEEAL